jgi:hypothetical protein
MKNSAMNLWTTQDNLIAAITKKYSEGLHELKEKLDEAASNLNLGVNLLVSEDEGKSDVGENARDLLRNHHKVACFYFRYVGYDVKDHYNTLSGEVDGYVISWNNEKGR